jgi:hypothetical protein
VGDYSACQRASSAIIKASGQQYHGGSKYGAWLKRKEKQADNTYVANVKIPCHQVAEMQNVKIFFGFNDLLVSTPPKR